MRTPDIAIIGGYGSTGSRLVPLLLAALPHSVRIGGRSGAKAEALAGELGPRVRGLEVDTSDRASLDAFCQGCEIVINCAGPSRLILDRAALAAWRAGAHYIDTGGDEPAYDLLAPQAGEIREDGLCFLLSAGVYPGLSSVYPAWAAETLFDSLESADVFLHFAGVKLSFNSAWDCLKSFRECGSGGTGSIEDGRAVFGRIQPRELDLPAPCGHAYCQPVYLEEMRRMAERHNVRNLRTYLVPGETALRALIEAKQSCNLTGGAEIEAAERLSRAVSGSGAACTLYHLLLEGVKDGERLRLVSTMRCDDDPSLLVARVLAATTRLLAAGEGTPGVGFLHEGVPADRFMSLLGPTVSIATVRD